MDDAIQNGVGEGGLPNDVVPRFDGQLAPVGVFRDFLRFERPYATFLCRMRLGIMAYSVWRSQRHHNSVILSQQVEGFDRLFGQLDDAFSRE